LLKIGICIHQIVSSEDDPVGSKHVGDTIRKTNKGLIIVLTLMSVFSLLAVEVQGLR